MVVHAPAGFGQQVPGAEAEKAVLAQARSGCAVERPDKDWYLQGGMGC